MSFTRRDYFEWEVCRCEFDTLEEAEKCCPSSGGGQTEWTCNKCGNLEFDEDEPTECMKCAEERR